MAMTIPSPMVVQTHTTASYVVGGATATPPPTPLKDGTALIGGFPSVAISISVPPSASLYVGDLDANVDESKLYDLFSQVAPVLSIRVCRDQQQNHLFRSLGYAYVNFNNPQDASYARDALNFTTINDKPMRIMFSHRDPTLRKSGYANLFIKNLDFSIDNKALYDTFAAFGTVLSCKVAYDHNGKPKGYGFVQFDKEESAQNARKRLNGMLINDKKVYVGPFVRRQERNEGKGCSKFSNVYVKNFSESMTDEALKEMFGKFGPITSAIVTKDTNGKSRCFGFVNFESYDDAASAVETLNGSLVNEKVLYVGKAEKKSEREAQLKAKFEQERNNRFEKLKGCNLYLKNIDDEINDDKLKELFSEFGTITSCKVVLDQKGVSKGAGFVAFSSPDEASKALNEMNGKMIGRKPLYAAVAQRKEERKNWLQTHFSQMRTPGTMSPLPRIPGIHPAGAAPRLAAQQQLYFGQVSPASLMPHAATTGGYGFQQQHLPTGVVMPGVPSNFVMPLQFQQQGQRAQRLGSRRGANSHQPQQQRNTNHVGNRYSDNILNGSQVRTESTMPSTLSKSTLASSLASASPKNRRMMLGEHLYPLVECLEPNHAGKVTGMLLEMDQTEVLHLIDSPDALKKKVIEAMDVLRLATSDGDQGF